MAAPALEVTPPPDSRRWVGLAFIAVAQLMIALDATIVSIALPSAQRALGASDADRQWVITAYTLAFGALLLLGGRIADLLGRKRAFLIGLAGFAVASVAGGSAPTFAVLVASRAVQGAFAALLAPTALSLLAVAFTEPKERATAFAVYGSIAGSGAAIGMLLGGVLTQYVSWRWCLYVNVPIAVVAGVGGWLYVPGSDARRRACRGRPGGNRLRLVITGSPAFRGGARAARPVRAARIANGGAAAAPAHPCRPRPRRRLPLGRPRACGHVRRVPVPHLLPPGGAPLLAAAGRRRVPADHRRLAVGVMAGRAQADAAGAAARPDGPRRPGDCGGPRAAHPASRGQRLPDRRAAGGAPARRRAVDDDGARVQHCNTGRGAAAGRRGVGRRECDAAGGRLARHRRPELHR